MQNPSSYYSPRIFTNFVEILECKANIWYPETGGKILHETSDIKEIGDQDQDDEEDV
jgi:hypothetical protein